MQLRFIRRTTAEHYMMAPAVAGGWVATHPDALEVVERALGAPRFLALVPATWAMDGRPATLAEARRIAVDLAATRYSVVDDTPTAAHEMAMWIEDAIGAGCAG